MIDSKLIDSSVWIAYLFEGTCKEYIEAPKINFISALSLFEIKCKLMKKKVPNEMIAKNMTFIKSKTIIIPINEKIAEHAAEISIKHNLPAADALIYASAVRNNSQLVTLDNDFRELPNVTIP